MRDARREIAAMKTQIKMIPVISENKDKRGDRWRLLLYSCQGHYFFNREVMHAFRLHVTRSPFAIRDTVAGETRNLELVTRSIEHAYDLE